MTDEEEKKNIKKDFFRFSQTHREEKKMLFCCFFSLTPLPVDSQQWMCRNLLQGDDKRDEDEWRSSRRDKSSVCLSFFLSVFTSPSRPLLTACDDVTRLLSRYMHPSFTHQAACNRTIPQFIFHIIVSPFWACHRGLALWALWRQGRDRRANRRKVEGCWASPRGCLAL